MLLVRMHNSFRSQTSIVIQPPRAQGRPQLAKQNLTADLPTLDQNVTKSLAIECYNQNPCCDFWSQDGFCKSDGKRAQNYCPVSCGVCDPSYDVKDGMVLRFEAPKIGSFLAEHHLPSTKLPEMLL